MDETVSQPEVDDQNSKIESDRKFLRGAAKKAAALVAVASVASGTLAGVELIRAGTELKADVPYQKYGKDGYHKPVVELSESRPTIAEIKPVYSDNPFEIAQQLLWLAANAERKVVLLKAWPGIREVSGVTLYHAPVGSTHFMPFNPNNNGEAGKLVIPPDEVAFIKNPVKLVTYNNEPDWILATLASDTATKNRATDIKQVYWLSLDDAEQNQAKFLAHKGSSSTGGYATVPTGDASVGRSGNFQFGTIPDNQLSVIEIVKRGRPQEKQAELGQVPALPPSNH